MSVDSVTHRWRVVLGCMVVVTLLSVVLSVRCAFAGKIRVGIGFALAPYVLKESGGGLEVDVIREAFRKQGDEAVFSFMPNLRLPVAYESGAVDCVATNCAYDLAGDSGREAYKSDLTVKYQNYAIALRDSKLAINSISDLGGKAVLGFNNAVKYLGPEYAFMADNNPEYRELADQSLQIRLLFSKRVQVVISDIMIFKYWHKRMRGSTMGDSMDLTQPLAFYPIFPPAPRCVFFARKKERDSFNAGLEYVRKSGVMDRLSTKYIGADRTLR